MSRTTGPILATGLATMANQSLFNGKPIDWRVPIATGLLAVGMNLMERPAPNLAVIFAWSIFATVMLTRTDPKVPSPVESAVTWWTASQKG